MAPITIAFDLYGTILSTDSIVKELVKLFGDEKAKVVATQARRYQLEYSWRINGMGMYQSFGELTRWSFRHAAAEVGEELSPEQEEKVMNAYNGLDAFPEVEAGLNLIAKTPDVEAYVFSNGTEDMITSSLSTSPSLARCSSVLPASRVVSVDPIRVFKPDQRTYAHFAKVAGVESQVDKKLWLVSSNPFDALGARAAGWRSVWVNRNPNLGWIDGLSGAVGLRPTVIAKGVDEAVRKIIEIDIEGKPEYGWNDWS